jgi:N-acetylmuramoyl-L-alanine amidase
MSRGVAGVRWRSGIFRVRRIGFWLVLSFLVTLTTVPTYADSLKAKNYKLAGDETRVRIVMQLDREPDLKWFLLRGPHRLVIDLPETDFAIEPRELKPRGLVTGVRYGHLEEGRSRMILATKGPFAVERIDVLANEDVGGYRLVADLKAASNAEFETALAEQTQTTASTRSTEKDDRIVPPVKPAAKRFTVVIDPGHGGIDGGAEGLNGTVEKTITLAFALELKKKLVETGSSDVFLTREKDEFLRLDERVRIARQHGADIFISIHADTIRLKGIRGATVYTVSDKASDAEAAATAARENLSDELAGISTVESKEEVADILIDLIRRETHNFSLRFARSLVDELSAGVQLINNPHRFAGFRVLQAPDVPSVLVELGYLSNPQDEAQLRDPEWRGKAVDRIAAAIAALATSRVGTNG